MILVCRSGYVTGGCSKLTNHSHIVLTFVEHLPAERPSTFSNSISILTSDEQLASNSTMPSKKVPVAKQKATIGWLDNGEGSTGASASSKVSRVGQDVIERIKKCFERAEHEEKNESEARAAVMMASKYLKKYNLSRADVMEHEDQNTRAARGGMSNVNIWPAKDGGAVKNQAWVNDLVCAIRKFFDCNSYSTNLHDSVEWTFYGIAEHTLSASIAFEMCHNLIQEWAGSYTTVAARNSYSLGVADGLCRLAEQERVDTENAAREAENKAFAARLVRLFDFSSSALTTL